jgi:carbamoyltransferase
MEYCLSAGGISPDDLDILAVSSKYPVPSLNYLFDLPEERREKKTLRSRTLDAYRRHFAGAVRLPPNNVQRRSVSKRTRVVHVEHHLAHAGSAYYSSGLRLDEKSLIVTCDGMGDGYSICIWRGENGTITPLQKYGTNGSLGWFYSNVTEALGWIHGDGEGKTMGLAPYGDPDKCKGSLESFYPKYSGCDLVEPHDFGTVCHWDQCGAMRFHFDESNDIRKIAEKYGRENVAAAAQRALEQQLVSLISSWLSREKTDILCAAGGVFLNVKLNQRLWNSGTIRKHWTYPNCGDSGLAHGAALVAYFQETSAEMATLADLYAGPTYSDAEICKLLTHRRISADYVENIEDAVSKLLAKDNIVGWFQGRMESGPRALGNRSILMSAASVEHKQVINSKVKYREAFRPFCPSIPLECAPQYLANFRPEPFMITSFDATAVKKRAIPAVVHEDGTVRPQTVARHANKRYWTLLHRFGELTGDPVLLNTSMNIMGEPIVCNPRDALKCFVDSGMDALALGNYLLTKDRP